MTLRNQQGLTRGLWYTGPGGGTSSSNYWTYSDTNIYDSFCSATRKVPGSLPANGPSDTWTTYEVAVTPSTWKCWVAGAPIASPTFTAGHTVDIGGDGSGLRWWLGQNSLGDGMYGFGTVVILNRIPTTQEQTDLRLWAASSPSGDVPLAPGGSGSRVDSTMAVLAGKGYTTGSIQDRQAAYLRAKTGLNKSSADMQKADGRVVTDLLLSSTVV